MHYYPLYVLDSGIANTRDDDSKSYTHNHFVSDIKSDGRFPDQLPDLILSMDRRRGSNSLNDILFTELNYVISLRAKSILEKHCLPPHVFIPVQVKRETTSKKITETKIHSYYWFYFNCEAIENYYDYIDFEKSVIYFYKAKNKERIPDIKLRNIGDLRQIIEQNGKISSEINTIYKRKDISDKQKEELCKELDTINWKAETISMNSKFNTETDIFCLPLFSQRTYVSKRLVQHFYGAEISGAKFGEIVTKNPEMNYPETVELMIKGPLG